MDQTDGKCKAHSCVGNQFLFGDSPNAKMSVEILRRNDLIRHPYWNCPFCNTVSSFGIFVMAGGGGAYTRRCTRCGRSRHIPFPTLNLRVIYVDQFVISNVVKALDPQTEPQRRAQLDPFWKIAFERLHRLCKLHLIIYPDSPLHYDESVVTGIASFKKLKRIYELLSGGPTFTNQSRCGIFRLPCLPKSGFPTRRTSGFLMPRTLQMGG